MQHLFLDKFQFLALLEYQFLVTKILVTHFLTDSEQVLRNMIIIHNEQSKIGVNLILSYLVNFIIDIEVMQDENPKAVLHCFLKSLFRTTGNHQFVLGSVFH